MERQLWTRVREVFDAASELSESERREFLDDACSGDEALRREVLELLGTDTDSAQARRLSAGAPVELLHGAGAAGIADAAGASMIGATIGPYRIERVLGSGGMGTVYAAVQDRPERVVALKTLRLGLRSPGARRRLEYESQVLARLRHPGIAQVYSAGTHRDADSGDEVPYFAMEYVEDARPLGAFVAESGLGVHGILELFLKICDAVQHGHQKGFIHRDLKPANILVDRNGQPKIIDFGIARATEAADASVHTLTGEVLGTLQYMSPEQLDVGGDAVDVRTDVYALGVILYELLTGRVPFDVAGRPLTAVARTLVEDRAPRPSSLALPRHGEKIPTELDWILLKAIDGDRERRYAAVSELAADIRRFRAHQTVLAGPPSAAYRLRAFVRRNRALVAGGVAVFVALVFGIAATTWQWLEARAASAEAGRQARQATAVNDFLTRVLTWGDPNEKLGGGGELRMREALDQASSLLEELEGEPVVEAAVRQTLGDAYRGLGLPDTAVEHARRALELRRAHLPAQHDDVANSLNSLALSLAVRGDHGEAARLLREAYLIFRSLHGEPDLSAARCLLNLSPALRNTGKHDEAERTIRRALRELRALEGDNLRFEATALDQLAAVLRSGGRKAEAAAAAREAIASYEHAGKGRHPYAANARWNLGHQLWSDGHVEDAEPLLRESLSIWLEALGEDHPATLRALTELGTLLYAAGDSARAEPLLSRALAGRQRRYGPTDVSTGAEHHRLGKALRSRGDHAQAELHFRSSYDIARVHYEPPHRQILIPLYNLVRALTQRGALEEAEPFARDAFDQATQLLDEDDEIRIGVTYELAEVARQLGRNDEAIALYTGLVEVRRRVSGDTARSTLSMMNNLAVSLGAADRWSEAEPWFRRCLEAREQIGEANTDRDLIARTNLARALEGQDRLDESVALFRDTMGRARDALAPDHWLHSALRKGYGVALTKRGEFAAAESELLASFSVFEPRFGVGSRRTQKLIEALVDLYERWDRPDDARKYRAMLAPAGDRDGR